jgi:type I restriction enzyme S subunit
MQNGKHAIARNLLDRFGFASTEFHVLRPKHDILPSWVHHFLLQPWVLRDAVTSFTGAAGQQRVPEAFLAGLEIPLAPLAEQKRIVAILNEQMAAVERARAATEAQLDAAKALPPAYLRAVFNSPEAKKWPVRPLGEVSTIVTGSTPPRAHTPFYGGTIPWVKPDDLDRATYVSSSAEYLTDEGSQVARLLPPGSVLVSCIGKLGKCAVAGRTLSTNQQINSLIPAADVDSLYLYCVCRDLGRQMASAASTALIPILNKSTFSRIVAPFPPFPEQQRIAAMLSEQMASADLLRKQLEEQLDTINRLPAALLRRAFNGSL